MSKTIEDYRNAVKLLKLKVIKLKKENETLQQQGGDGAPIIDETQDLSQLTNQQVMQLLLKQVKRLGMTPEMLFRSCDEEYQGQIKAEDFRMFLSKIKLGLGQGMINMIVKIFDEDCSGLIKLEEYNETLQAYGINQEKSGGHQRTYGQESLLKYAHMLIQRRLDQESSYSQIDSHNQGFITQPQLMQFCGGDLGDKQIVSIFNVMDVYKKGQVNKNIYEQEVRKALKAAAIEQGINPSTISNVNQNSTLQKGLPAFQQQNSPMPQVQKGNLPSNPAQNLVKKPSTQLSQAGSINQQLPQQQSGQVSRQGSNIGAGPIGDSSVALTISSLVAKTRPLQDIKNVVQKLTTQGVDINKIIEQVVDTLQNPYSGIFVQDFQTAFAKYPKVNQQDILNLFQSLDSGLNGSIDYDELMKVWLLVRKKGQPFDPLFEILGRKLQALCITVEEYLLYEQIHKGMSVPKQEFQVMAKILFEVQDADTCNEMFDWMDKDKSGSLSTDEIIDSIQAIIDKYEPPEDNSKPIANLAQSMLVSQLVPNQSAVVVNPEKQQKNQSLHALGNVSIDLDDLGRALAKVKPKLDPKDFFNKRWLDNGKIQEKPWTTILNSEEACLRKIYEILVELKKKDDHLLGYWDDPDFGPIASDPQGSKSMYFSENDITPGCPEPADVIWMRPRDILAKLVADGESALQNQKVEVFDGGAASNDVMQSKYLGDCWFVSALSIIATNDSLLKGNFQPDQQNVNNISDKEVVEMSDGVYPPVFHFTRQWGIYVFKFYKNFSWRFVIIDDKLCFKDEDYVYAKCRKPNELWVQLIEKSYAKLHNCYQALTSGDIAQGLADMTSHTADKTKIDSAKFADKNYKEQFWQTLLQAKQNQTLMGCSADGQTEEEIKINGEESGIMTGHAYAITDIFELKDPACKNSHKSHRLLKIRNPWGYGEWKLKWSEEEEFKDRTEKYVKQIDQYYQTEIANAKAKNIEPPEPYQFGVDDGTFLMCYKDFRNTFTNLFKCINFPANYNSKFRDDLWTAAKDSFGAPQKDKLADYAKNPQFIINLACKKSQTTKLYFQLTQMDGRLFVAEKYPFQNVMQELLLCLFTLDNNEASLKEFDMKKMKCSSDKINLRREVSIEEIALPNGKYSLIPCTKVGGITGKYSVTIFFDCDPKEITITKLNDNSAQFDLVNNDLLNPPKKCVELKQILKDQAVADLKEN